VPPTSSDPVAPTSSGASRADLKPRQSRRPQAAPVAPTSSGASRANQARP
jgi:hypothetical protein